MWVAADIQREQEFQVLRNNGLTSAIPTSSTFPDIDPSTLITDDVILKTNKNGVHNTLLRNRLLEFINTLDQEVFSAAGCEACKTFITKGYNALESPEDVAQVTQFLELARQPETATALGLSFEDISELKALASSCTNDTCLGSVGNESLIMRAKAIRSSVIDASGMTAAELKFRRRQYMVNPDSASIHSYVDDLFSNGVLTESMSTEELSAALLKDVQTRFKYKNDVGSDHWQTVEETMSLGVGDCEDLSLLLGSATMNALKRQGFSDTQVRDMVHFTAGYVNDGLGRSIAGHMVVKVTDPESGTSMVLDATSQMGPVASDVYGMDEVFEFNDQSFEAFQAIDAMFETAIQVNLVPGTTFDDVSVNQAANSLMFDIESEIQLIEDMVKVSIDVPIIKNGNLLRKAISNPGGGSSDPFALETIIEEINSNNVSGIRYRTSTGKYEDPTFPNGKSDVIYNPGDSFLLVGGDKGELVDIYGSKAGHYRERIVDSGGNVTWRRYTYDEFLELDDKSKVYRTLQVYREAPIDSVSVDAFEGSFRNSDGTVNLDPTSSFNENQIAQFNFFHINKIEIEADEVSEFFMHTVVLDHDALFNYINSIQDRINKATILFLMAFSYMDLLLNEAGEIDESNYEGTDFEQELKNMRRSAQNERSKFIQSWDKWHQKTGQGVQQVAEQILRYVAATNEAEGMRAQMAIEMWPREPQSDQGIDPLNVIADMFLGVLGPMADELTGVISQRKAAARHQLAKVRALSAAKHSRASMTLAKRSTDRILLWNPDELVKNPDLEAEIKRDMSDSRSGVRSFGGEVFDAQQGNGTERYQDGLVSKQYLINAFNQIGVEQAINDTSASVDHQSEIQQLIKAIDRSDNGFDPTLSPSMNNLNFLWDNLDLSSQRDEVYQNVAGNTRPYLFNLAKHEDRTRTNQAVSQENPERTDPNEAQRERVIANNALKEERDTLRSELDALIANDASQAEIDAKQAELDDKIAELETALSVEKLEFDLMAASQRLSDLEAAVPTASHGMTLEESLVDAEEQRDVFALLRNDQTLTQDERADAENRYNFYNRRAEELSSDPPEITPHPTKSVSAEIEELSETVVNLAVSVDEAREEAANGGPRDPDEAIDIAGDRDEFLSNNQADTGRPTVAPEPGSVRKFLDYNMPRQADLRRSLLDYQNFIRSALTMKQLLEDRKREVSQEFSNSIGTSASKTLSRATAQAVEAEIGKLTTYFNASMNDSVKLHDAMNELVDAQIQYYKESRKMIMKSTKLGVGGGIYAASLVSGVAAGVAGSIVGLMESYWTFAFNTTATSISDIAFASWEYDIENRVREYNRPHVTQTSINPYNTGSSLTFINEAKRGARDSNKEASLRLYDTDDQRDNESVQYYSNRLDEILLDSRLLYSQAETKQFYNNLEPDSPNSDFVPVFIADRHDGFYTQDGFQLYQRESNQSIDPSFGSAFESPSWNYFSRIRMHLIVIYAFYEAVENVFSQMFETENRSSIQKFDNAVDAYIQYETQLMEGHKQEVSFFLAGANHNSEKNKNVRFLRDDLITSAANALASLLAFIPTDPAGRAASGLAKEIIDTASSIRKTALGPYSGSAAEYRNNNPTTGRRADTPDAPDLSSFDPNVWDTSTLTATSPDDVDIARQIIEDAKSSNGQTTISSNFNQMSDEEIVLEAKRLAPWQKSLEKEKLIFAKFYNESQFDPRRPTDLPHTSINFEDAIIFQQEMNNEFTFRTILLALENALYHAKQETYREMFGISSAARILQKAQSLVDRYNDVQLSAFQGLVTEFSSRAEANNVYQTNLIETSIVNSSRAVLAVMFRLYSPGSPDPDAGEGEKYQDFFRAWLAAQTARMAVQATANIIVGMVGLLSETEDPKADSEFINYEEDSSSARSEEEKEKKSSKTEEEKRKERQERLLGRISQSSTDGQPSDLGVNTQGANHTGGGRSIMNAGIGARSRTRITRRARQVKMMREVSNSLMDAIANTAASFADSSSSGAHSGLLSILDRTKNSQLGISGLLMQASQVKMQMRNQNIQRMIQGLTSLATEGVGFMFARLANRQKKKKELAKKQITSEQAGKSSAQQLAKNIQRDTQKVSELRNAKTNALNAGDSATASKLTKQINAAEKRIRKAKKSLSRVEANLAKRTAKKKAINDKISQLEASLNNPNNSAEDIQNIRRKIDKAKKKRGADLKEMNPNETDLHFNKRAASHRRSETIYTFLRGLQGIIGVTLAESLASLFLPAMVDDDDEHPQLMLGYVSSINAQKMSIRLNQLDQLEDDDGDAGGDESLFGGTADLENAILSMEFEKSNQQAFLQNGQSSNAAFNAAAKYFRPRLEGRISRAFKNRLEERLKKNMQAAIAKMNKDYPDEPKNMKTLMNVWREMLEGKDGEKGTGTFVDRSTYAIANFSLGMQEYAAKGAIGLGRFIFGTGKAANFRDVTRDLRDQDAHSKESIETLTDQKNKAEIELKEMGEFNPNIHTSIFGESRAQKNFEKRKKTLLEKAGKYQTRLLSKSIDGIYDQLRDESLSQSAKDELLNTLKKEQEALEKAKKIAHSKISFTRQFGHIIARLGLVGTINAAINSALFGSAVAATAPIALPSVLNSERVRNTARNMGEAGLIPRMKFETVGEMTQRRDNEELFKRGLNRFTLDMTKFDSRNEKQAALNTSDVNVVRRIKMGQRDLDDIMQFDTSLRSLDRLHSKTISRESLDASLDEYQLSGNGVTAEQVLGILDEFNRTQSVSAQSDPDDPDAPPGKNKVALSATSDERQRDIIRRLSQKTGVSDTDLAPFIHSLFDHSSRFSDDIVNQAFLTQLEAAVDISHDNSRSGRVSDSEFKKIVKRRFGLDDSGADTFLATFKETMRDKGYIKNGGIQLFNQAITSDKSGVTFRTPFYERSTGQDGNDPLQEVVESLSHDIGQLLSGPGVSQQMLESEMQAFINDISSSLSSFSRFSDVSEQMTSFIADASSRLADYSKMNADKVRRRNRAATDLTQVSQAFLDAQKSANNTVDQVAARYSLSKDGKLTETTDTTVNADSVLMVFENQAAGDDDAPFITVVLPKLMANSSDEIKTFLETHTEFTSLSHGSDDAALSETRELFDARQADVNAANKDSSTLQKAIGTARKNQSSGLIGISAASQRMKGRMQTLELLTQSHHLNNAEDSIRRLLPSDIDADQELRPDGFSSIEKDRIIAALKRRHALSERGHFFTASETNRAALFQSAINEALHPIMPSQTLDSIALARLSERTITSPDELDRFLLSSSLTKKLQTQIRDEWDRNGSVSESFISPLLTADSMNLTGLSRLPDSKESHRHKVIAAFNSHTVRTLNSDGGAEFFLSEDFRQNEDQIIAHIKTQLGLNSDDAARDIAEMLKDSTSAGMSDPRAEVAARSIEETIARPMQAVADSYRNIVNLAREDSNHSLSDMVRILKELSEDGDDIAIIQGDGGITYQKSSLSNLADSLAQYSKQMKSTMSDTLNLFHFDIENMEAFDRQDADRHITGITGYGFSALKPLSELRYASPLGPEDRRRLRFVRMQEGEDGANPFERLANLRELTMQYDARSIDGKAKDIVKDFNNASRKLAGMRSGIHGVNKRVFETIHDTGSKLGKMIDFDGDASQAAALLIEVGKQMNQNAFLEHRSAAIMGQILMKFSVEDSIKFNMLVSELLKQSEGDPEASTLIVGAINNQSVLFDTSQNRNPELQKAMRVITFGRVGRSLNVDDGNNGLDDRKDAEEYLELSGVDYDVAFPKFADSIVNNSQFAAFAAHSAPTDLSTGILQHPFAKRERLGEALGDLFRLKQDPNATTSEMKDADQAITNLLIAFDPSESELTKIKKGLSDEYHTDVDARLEQLSKHGERFSQTLKGFRYDHDSKTMHELGANQSALFPNDIRDAGYAGSNLMSLLHNGSISSGTLGQLTTRSGVQDLGNTLDMAFSSGSISEANQVVRAIHTRLSDTQENGTATSDARNAQDVLSALEPVLQRHRSQLHSSARASLDHGDFHRLGRSPRFDGEGALLARQNEARHLLHITRDSSEKHALSLELQENNAARDDFGRAIAIALVTNTTDITSELDPLTHTLKKKRGHDNDSSDVEKISVAEALAKVGSEYLSGNDGDARLQDLANSIVTHYKHLSGQFDHTKQDQLAELTDQLKKGSHHHQRLATFIETSAKAAVANSELFAILQKGTYDNSRGRSNAAFHVDRTLNNSAASHDEIHRLHRMLIQDGGDRSAASTLVSDVHFINPVAGKPYTPQSVTLLNGVSTSLPESMTVNEAQTYRRYFQSAMDTMQAVLTMDFGPIINLKEQDIDVKLTALETIPLSRRSVQERAQLHVLHLVKKRLSDDDNDTISLAIDDFLQKTQEAYDTASNGFRQVGTIGHMRQVPHTTSSQTRELANKMILGNDEVFAASPTAPLHVQLNQLSDRLQSFFDETDVLNNDEIRSLYSQFSAICSAAFQHGIFDPAHVTHQDLANFVRSLDAQQTQSPPVLPRETQILLREYMQTLIAVRYLDSGMSVNDDISSQLTSIHQQSDIDTLSHAAMTRLEMALLDSNKTRLASFASDRSEMLRDYIDNARPSDDYLDVLKSLSELEDPNIKETIQEMLKDVLVARFSGDITPEIASLLSRSDASKVLTSIRRSVDTFYKHKLKQHRTYDPHTAIERTRLLIHQFERGDGSHEDVRDHIRHNIQMIMMPLIKEGANDADSRRMELAELVQMMDESITPQDLINVLNNTAMTSHIPGITPSDRLQEEDNLNEEAHQSILRDRFEHLISSRNDRSRNDEQVLYDQLKALAFAAHFHSKTAENDKTVISSLSGMNKAKSLKTFGQAFNGKYIDLTNKTVSEDALSHLVDLVSHPLRLSHLASTNPKEYSNLLRLFSAIHVGTPPDDLGLDNALFTRLNDIYTHNVGPSTAFYDDIASAAGMFSLQNDLHFDTTTTAADILNRIRTENSIARSDAEVARLLSIFALNPEVFTAAMKHGDTTNVITGLNELQTITAASALPNGQKNASLNMLRAAMKTVIHQQTSGYSKVAEIARRAKQNSLRGNHRSHTDTMNELRVRLVILEPELDVLGIKRDMIDAALKPMHSIGQAQFKLMSLVKEISTATRTSDRHTHILMAQAERDLGTAILNEMLHNPRARQAYSREFTSFLKQLNEIQPDSNGNHPVKTVLSARNADPAIMEAFLSMIGHSGESKSLRTDLMTKADLFNIEDSIQMSRVLDYLDHHPEEAAEVAEVAANVYHQNHKKDPNYTEAQKYQIVGTLLTRVLERAQTLADDPLVMTGVSRVISVINNMNLDGEAFESLLSAIPSIGSSDVGITTDDEALNIRAFAYHQMSPRYRHLYHANLENMGVLHLVKDRAETYAVQSTVNSTMNLLRQTTRGELTADVIKAKFQFRQMALPENHRQEEFRDLFLDELLNTRAKIISQSHQLAYIPDPHTGHRPMRSDDVPAFIDVLSEMIDDPLTRSAVFDAISNTPDSQQAIADFIRSDRFNAVENRSIVFRRSTTVETLLRHPGIRQRVLYPQGDRPMAINMSIDNVRPELMYHAVLDTIHSGRGLPSLTLSSNVDINKQFMSQFLKVATTNGELAQLRPFLFANRELVQQALTQTLINDARNQLYLQHPPAPPGWVLPSGGVTGDDVIFIMNTMDDEPFLAHVFGQTIDTLQTLYNDSLMTDTPLDDTAVKIMSKRMFDQTLAHRQFLSNTSETRYAAVMQTLISSIHDHVLDPTARVVGQEDILDMVVSTLDAYQEPYRIDLSSSDRSSTHFSSAIFANNSQGDDAISESESARLLEYFALKGVLSIRQDATGDTRYGFNIDEGANEYVSFQTKENDPSVDVRIATIDVVTLDRIIGHRLQDETPERQQAITGALMKHIQQVFQDRFNGLSDQHRDLLINAASFEHRGLGHALFQYSSQHSPIDAASDAKNYLTYVLGRGRLDGIESNRLYDMITHGMKDTDFRYRFTQVGESPETRDMFRQIVSQPDAYKVMRTTGFLDAGSPNYDSRLTDVVHQAIESLSTEDALTHFILLASKPSIAASVPALESTLEDIQSFYSQHGFVRSSDITSMTTAFDMLALSTMTQNDIDSLQSLSRLYARAASHDSDAQSKTVTAYDRAKQHIRVKTPLDPNASLRPEALTLSERLGDLEMASPEVAALRRPHMWDSVDFRHAVVNDPALRAQYLNDLADMSPSDITSLNFSDPLFAPKDDLGNRALIDVLFEQALTPIEQGYRRTIVSHFYESELRNGFDVSSDDATVENSQAAKKIHWFASHDFQDIVLPNDFILRKDKGEVSITESESEAIWERLSPAYTDDNETAILGINGRLIAPLTPSVEHDIRDRLLRLGLNAAQIKHVLNVLRDSNSPTTENRFKRLSTRVVNGFSKPEHHKRGLLKRLQMAEKHYNYKVEDYPPIWLLLAPLKLGVAAVQSVWYIPKTLTTLTIGLSAKALGRSEGGRDIKRSLSGATSSTSAGIHRLQTFTEQMMSDESLSIQQRSRLIESFMMAENGRHEANILRYITRKAKTPEEKMIVTHAMSTSLKRHRSDLFSQPFDVKQPVSRIIQDALYRDMKHGSGDLMYSLVHTIKDDPPLVRVLSTNFERMYREKSSIDYLPKFEALMKRAAMDNNNDFREMMFYFASKMSYEGWDVSWVHRAVLNLNRFSVSTFTTLGFTPESSQEILDILSDPDHGYIEKRPDIVRIPHDQAPYFLTGKELTNDDILDIEHILKKKHLNGRTLSNDDQQKMMRQIRQQLQAPREYIRHMTNVSDAIIRQGPQARGEANQFNPLLYSRAYYDFDGEGSKPHHADRPPRSYNFLSSFIEKHTIEGQPMLDLMHSEFQQSSKKSPEMIRQMQQGIVNRKAARIERELLDTSGQVHTESLNGISDRKSQPLSVVQRNTVLNVLQDVGWVDANYELSSVFPKDINASTLPIAIRNLPYMDAVAQVELARRLDHIRKNHDITTAHRSSIMSSLIPDNFNDVYKASMPTYRPNASDKEKDRNRDKIQHRRLMTHYFKANIYPKIGSALGLKGYDNASPRQDLQKTNYVPINLDVKRIAKLQTVFRDLLDTSVTLATTVPEKDRVSEYNAKKSTLRSQLEHLYATVPAMFMDEFNALPRAGDGQETSEQDTVAGLMGFESGDALRTSFTKQETFTAISEKAISQANQPLSVTDAASHIDEMIEALFDVENPADFFHTATAFNRVMSDSRFQSGTQLKKSVLGRLDVDASNVGMSALSYVLKRLRDANVSVTETSMDDIRRSLTLIGLATSPSAAKAPIDAQRFNNVLASKTEISDTFDVNQDEARHTLASHLGIDPHTSDTIEQQKLDTLTGQLQDYGLLPEPLSQSFSMDTVYSLNLDDKAIREDLKNSGFSDLELDRLRTSFAEAEKRQAMLLEMIEGLAFTGEFDPDRGDVIDRQTVVDFLSKTQQNGVISPPSDDQLDTMIAAVLMRMSQRASKRMSRAAYAQLVSKNTPYNRIFEARAQSEGLQSFSIAGQRKLYTEDDTRQRNIQSATEEFRSHQDLRRYIDTLNQVFNTNDMVHEHQHNT